MKLKYSFRIMQIVDDQVAVPVGISANEFHGAIRVNSIAGDILKLLENNITEEEIVDQLLSEYEADITQIEQSVKYVIGILRAEHLLEE